jgi:hypothetical protein
MLDPEVYRDVENDASLPIVPDSVPEFASMYDTGILDASERATWSNAIQDGHPRESFRHRERRTNAAPQTIRLRGRRARGVSA